jgi:hypothetical protein
MLRPLLFGLVLIFTAAQAEARDFDHSDWTRLLKADVMAIRGGDASEVDYAAFKRDLPILRAYVKSTETVNRLDFDTWSKPQQLAFLINVYNARTVELVLTVYPKLKSIKDLGNLIESPWKKRFFILFDTPTSLDDIEQGLIRGSGRYNDPRVHFALNCASIGCPALRPEAYDGARLEAQLEEQTHHFLADRTRNGFVAGSLRVSPLFDWYRTDFEKGWRGARTVRGFLTLYAHDLGLSTDQTSALSSGKLDLSFGAYDWRLNARRP